MSPYLGFLDVMVSFAVSNEENYFVLDFALPQLVLVLYEVDKTLPLGFIAIGVKYCVCFVSAIDQAQTRLRCLELN